MDSPGGFEEERVLEALERVLHDPSIAASDNLQRFLRYIVTETLAGRAARLKAYTIALSVFGRSENFNPQTNSLVRVEATRLRRLLSAHYARSPNTEAGSFEIQLPKGAYVPRFVRRPPVALAIAAPPGPPATVPAVVVNRRRIFTSAIAALALVVLTATIGFSFLPVSKFPPDDQPENALTAWERPPSLSITPLQFETGLLKPSQARALNIETLAALAGFDFLRVYDFGDGQPSRQTDYRLEAHASRAESQLTLLFRLLHTGTNQVIWSQSFRSLPFDLTSDARQPVIAKVASILGRTYGIIFTDRFRRMPPSSEATIGFACIIDGYQYFNAPSLKTFQQVLDCADRTIAANPKSSTGYALLANMLIDGHLKGYAAGRLQETALESALQAASIAVDLNQHSSQAHRAVFLARFYDGRFDEAFAAAKRALALNPYSMEIRSRVGSASILRGDFDSGMKLLDAVSSVVDNRANWLEFYYFLNAYQNNRKLEAKRHAFRASVTKTPLGAVARIITLHRQGDGPAARKWVDYLEREFPEFAIDVRAAFGRMQMIPEIADRLTDDLEAAGLSAKRLNTAHGIR